MNVKIYGTSTCPYCKMAREYLEKKGVVFEDIDVEENEAATDEMIQKSGGTSVPVIDIDGTILIGFDMEAIDQALQKLPQGQKKAT